MNPQPFALGATMISNSATTTFRLAAAGLVLALLLGHTATGDEWLGLDDHDLATVGFEGVTLPVGPRELKKRFPDIKRDKQRTNAAIGLDCYQLDDVKNADAARFYYLDGQLYQLEIVYKLARVKQMGGMQAIVRKLIDTWGPADHVGERRWTWQRPMYSRRADFYGWPGESQLTFTDMGLSPVVANRVKRQDQKKGLDLGF